MPTPTPPRQRGIRVLNPRACPYTSDVYRGPFPPLASPIPHRPAPPATLAQRIVRAFKRIL